MARGDCGPAWAPNGTFLLNTRRPGNRAVMRANFNAATAKVSPSRVLVGLEWTTRKSYVIHGQRVSNDSKWVAYGGKIGGNREIYLWKIGEPQGNSVRLTFDSGEDKSPSVYVPAGNTTARSLKVPN